jgi:hypothetical protein
MGPFRAINLAMSDGVQKMGFFRTVAMMIVGVIAIKTLKRAMKNIEAQQVKAKVNEQQKPQGEMKRLRLDPITGVYVPDA